MKNTSQFYKNTDLYLMIGIFYVTLLFITHAAIVVGCRKEACSIQCFVCLAGIQRRFDRHYMTRPVVVTTGLGAVTFIDEFKWEGRYVARALKMIFQINSNNKWYFKKFPKVLILKYV